MLRFKKILIMKNNFIAPRVQTVVIVFPSTSGNYRVKVIYADRSIPPLHFYMKPDGSLHIPEGHKTKPVVMLNDQEMEWCFRYWKKTNPNVRKETFSSGSIFGKAAHLSNEIQFSFEYQRREQLKKEAGKVETPGFATEKLGGAFTGIFSKLKAKLSV
jgi:hypothetical protein